MKLLCTAVILFAAGLCGVAVLFSPFAMFDNAEVYADNVPVYTVSGICYPADAAVRAELAGGEKELRAALSEIGGTEVKRTECGGETVVYAYSPRVLFSLMLSSGERYNIMASISERGIVIGAPVLQGSY